MNWTKDSQVTKSNGQQICFIKVFNLLSHWGDANKNFFEIPSHSVEIAIIKKTKDSKDMEEE